MEVIQNGRKEMDFLFCKLIVFLQTVALEWRLDASRCLGVQLLFAKSGDLLKVLQPNHRLKRIIVNFPTHLGYLSGHFYFFHIERYQGYLFLHDRLCDHGLIDDWVRPLLLHRFILLSLIILLSRRIRFLPIRPIIFHNCNV